MRKLISLLLAVVMVMSLASVAFATENTDAGDHTISAEADIPTSFTLAAGETATYYFEAGSDAAKAVWNQYLYLTGTGVGMYWVYAPYFGYEMNEYNDYTVSNQMWDHYTSGYYVQVENTGTETATYTMSFLGAPGTIGNPDVLDLQYTNYPYTSQDEAGEYYYEYTAGETAEVLTINNVSVSYNVMNMSNLNFNVIMTRDDNKEVSLWNDGVYADEIYMPLSAGQTVNVMVRAAEIETTYSSPSVTFKANAAQVTEISLIGDYVVESDVAWYAVNGMLAGSTIVVDGDDASIMLNDTVINAVDGIATAVLDGESPVILVKVTNATDMIIVPAPIEINAAGDYDVPGAEVTYAINSKLAGYTIVVDGENASINMGGTVINAVDGVATAVLNGEGATIAVTVYNGEDMIILPPDPIVINAAGDYDVSGAEVTYAINSMLAGYTIVVQGENASIKMGNTVINAVDGVATAVLNGEGATIAVTVYNGEDLIILPAPTEINAVGDYSATVAAGAEVEYAVNSKLAGAVLTVKGEGAYIYMNGTKYDAVDGVATAVLDGTGATIAVKVGNAGNAAAEYALNIAFLPISINAAGDYEVTVGAGAEVEYVVNSKLDGAVITVKGEGAYLIVDGVKIEGKDGVVTATLTAKGATISVIVGNAGTAAAEWTVNVAVPTNSKTGDFGVIAAVIALATSAIGGTAVIAKKKED